MFDIPELTVLLLSMGMFLQKQNHVVGFADCIHIINQKGKTIISCMPWHKHEETVYWACTHIENPESLMDITVSMHTADYQIWHRHLGHMSEQALFKMPQNTKDFPSKLLKHRNEPLCSGCMEGKMTFKSFPDSKSQANECFELIHSDLKSFPITSYHKYRYMILFVDNKSSHYWVQCLHLKSDAKKTIKQFDAMVKTQYRSIIC